MSDLVVSVVERAPFFDRSISAEYQDLARLVVLCPLRRHGDGVGPAWKARDLDVVVPHDPHAKSLHDPERPPRLHHPPSSYQTRIDAIAATMSSTVDRHGAGGRSEA